MEGFLILRIVESQPVVMPKFWDIYDFVFSDVTHPLISNFCPCESLHIHLNDYCFIKSLKKQIKPKVPKTSGNKKLLLLLLLKQNHKFVENYHDDIKNSNIPLNKC